MVLESFRAEGKSYEGISMGLWETPYSAHVCFGKQVLQSLQYVACLNKAVKYCKCSEGTVLSSSGVKV